MKWSNLVRVGFGALVVPTGISCSSQQFVRVHNRSDTILSCQRLSQPLAVGPGESGRLLLASSKTYGLSVPLLEARARVSEKHGTVELNGVRYELPAAYLERIETWEGRSWVSQVLDSNAGDLSYWSRGRVQLTDGGQAWDLEGGSD
ncbi:MAG: hypothetical protein ACR2RV_20815 [Verrucomicrobiales bacterium]